MDLWFLKKLIIWPEDTAAAMVVGIALTLVNSKKSKVISKFERDFLP
jgi:hypothetical protein